MSRYGIKAVFNTLQGEGLRAGTRAVFVRFSGCNLWDGHPLHREVGAGACARWCDTDFYKGGVIDLETLLATMDKAWPAEEAMGVRAVRWCVLTGGEPMLQVDDTLVDALHDAGWRVALETNGTIYKPVACKIDHICISPKRGGVIAPHWAEHEVEEVKVVLPGCIAGDPRGQWTDADLEALHLQVPSTASFVQPMDPVLDESLVSCTVLKGGDGVVDEETSGLAEAQLQANTERCISFVMSHPTWRVTVQVHKMLGLD